MSDMVEETLDSPAPVWCVYLVRRSDGALYTGIATDVTRRIEEHRAGRGAKALRGRGPLELVAHGEVGDRSAAQRVEGRIKRLSKSDKEALVASPTGLSDLTAGLRSEPAE